jgi:cystathionine beta-lyase
MVSFELDGTPDEVSAFVSSRRWFTLAESLGGVKALICHPARMTHASIPADKRRALGLSDALIRLSPGLEHPDDLVEDLTEGLEGVHSEPSALATSTTRSSASPLTRTRHGLQQTSQSWTKVPRTSGST